MCRFFIAVFLLMATAGCSNIMKDFRLATVEDIPSIQDNPQFTQMKDSFFIAMEFRSGKNLRSLDVPAEFAELSGSNVGECHTLIRGKTILYKYIQIDPAYWNSVAPQMQEALMFHELGHCVLNRAHSTRVDLATGQPVSYMFPSMDSHFSDSTSRETLLDELIQNSAIMGPSRQGKVANLHDSAGAPESDDLYDVIYPITRSGTELIDAQVVVKKLTN